MGDSLLDDVYGNLEIRRGESLKTSSSSRLRVSVLKTVSSAEWAL